MMATLIFALINFVLQLANLLAYDLFSHESKIY
jgi:hypothetical protein